MLTLTNLKKKTLFVLFAALLALLSIGTSFAAGRDGSTPDQGLTPGSQMTLQGGESVWYAFDYGLDVSRKPVDVSIWVEGNPDSGTNFEVWTAERLQEWARQQPGHDDVKGIGMGSQSDFTAGNYFWTGKFYQSGTYYVEVKNDTLAESTHTLYVTGDTVTLREAASEATKAPAAEATKTPAAEATKTPAAEATKTPAAEATKTPAAEATKTPAAEATKTPAAEATKTPAAEATKAPAAEATTAKGTSPENALRMSGEWKELQAGASIWYAFDYHYDSSSSTEASVWMNSVPDNGINFEIWTSERLQKRWDNTSSDEVDAVGRGSKSDSTPGDYFWTGGFSQSGTYYVLVKNMNSTSSYYQLYINNGQ